MKIDWRGFITLINPYHSRQHTVYHYLMHRNDLKHLKPKKQTSIQTRFNLIWQIGEAESFYCVVHNISKNSCIVPEPQCGANVWPVWFTDVPQGVMKRTSQMFDQAPMQSVHNQVRQTRVWCSKVNLQKQGQFPLFKPRQMQSELFFPRTFW